MFAYFLFMAMVITTILLLTGMIWWGIRTGITLAVNSIVGFFALFAVKLVVPTLVIDFWSVLVVALLGIVGLAFILFFHVTGIGF